MAEEIEEEQIQQITTPLTEKETISLPSPRGQQYLSPRGDDYVSAASSGHSSSLMISDDDEQEDITAAIINDVAENDDDDHNNNDEMIEMVTNSATSSKKATFSVSQEEEDALKIPLMTTGGGPSSPPSPTPTTAPPPTPTSRLKQVFRSRNTKQQQGQNNDNSNDGKNKRNIRNRKKFKHTFQHRERGQFNPLKRPCNYISRNIPCLLGKDGHMPCFQNKEQQKGVLKGTIKLMNILARILFWCSVLILAVCVVWYSYELKKNGKDPHLIAWFSAGAFVLLGFPISMWGIVMHLANYNQPNIQCYIVRILWMVPM